MANEELTRGDDCGNGGAPAQGAGFAGGRDLRAPGAHRAAERIAEGLPERSARTRHGHSTSGRDGNPQRPVPRAAARRAGGGKGPVRHQGGTHDLRLHHHGGAHRRAARHREPAPRGRWRRPAGHAEHARIRLGRHVHQSPLRHAAQPVGRRPHSGRLQRRLGGGYWGRAGNGDLGIRHRRFDPNPGVAERCRGPEADIWPGEPIRRLPAVLVAGSPRAPDSQRPPMPPSCCRPSPATTPAIPLPAASRCRITCSNSRATCAAFASAYRARCSSTRSTRRWPRPWRPPSASCGAWVYPAST